MRCSSDLSRARRLARMFVRVEARYRADIRSFIRETICENAYVSVCKALCIGRITGYTEACYGIENLREDRLQLSQRIVLSRR
ncbi:hypothetical protein Pan241w_32280 [Gimesia alba]|uniref:Uncharacterized protein n=1 Tax=Gimesia alba TaxID=2527973 RepID=A0A517RGZ3_9PLAN|nr:hypothetical protein Pan241w_32280 [Gimesia alba]